MTASFHLPLVGGLSTREIARLLGIQEAAARQRLVRARKLFQRLYLMQSGEFVIDSSSLKPQAETQDQQIAGATRAVPVMTAAGIS